MLRHEAEKKAREMLWSGYRHHTYLEEKQVYGSLLTTERDDFIRFIYAPNVYGLLDRYADVLGPNRQRGYRNSMICLITSLCRFANDCGVDAEFSFALSDFYINEAERRSEKKQFLELMQTVLLHYYDLIQEARLGHYSRTVAQAVRFIERRLHSVVSVREVAEFAGCNPRYLSSRFTKELGMTPSKYILSKKMREAETMLCQMRYTVAETADVLGFCDVAHFSNHFHRFFNCAPSTYLRGVQAAD